MSTLIKYRVHEVAKDFKTTSKVIGEILTEYATPPKNHMQVLEENELDLIFEYLTQHNQVSSIEEIYNDAGSKDKKAEAAPDNSGKAQQAGGKVSPSAGQPDAKAGTRAGGKAQQGSAASASGSKETAKEPQAGSKADAGQKKEHTPRKIPEKRIIDTSGATINIAKYDERLENLIPDRAQNMKQGGFSRSASSDYRIEKSLFNRKIDSVQCVHRSG